MRPAPPASNDHAGILQRHTLIPAQSRPLKVLTMSSLPTDSSPGNTRHNTLLTGRAPSPTGAIYPLTLFYESACPLCHAEISNLMLRNPAGQLAFVDISAPGFDSQPPGTTQQDLLACMHAVTADGRVIKGVDVFRLAYDAVGLGTVSTFLRLPVVRQLADWGYPVLARNRHRLPSGLAALMFGGPIRRAAERAARERCEGGSCSR